MLKRTLSAVWFGAVFAVSVLLTSAFALTITGRNSDSSRSIFQGGILAATPETAITATPSGTQVNSYQLTAGVSQITTIGTTGDGVKLPSTSSLNSPSNLDASLNIVVINATAATTSLNIWPFASTDVISTTTSVLGAGAALVIAPHSTAECWSISTGKWYCTVG